MRATYTSRNKPWTDILIAETKALYESGKYSAAKIGDKVGKTRGAIIGKAHREGWVNPTPQRNQNKPRPSGPRIRNRKRAVNIDAVFPYGKVLGLPPEPEKPENCLNLTILQLTDKTCKFPHGDAAPFLFCGLATVNETPYCKYHGFKCYRAPPPRGGQTAPHVVGISK